jgi:GNAT superfamily N-acetyltransferase
MTPADWATLRDLRLLALADVPTAFYATYAKEAAMTDADWRARAVDWSAGAKCQTFIAYDATNTPCGLAAGIRNRTDPSVAVLISMWVHASARKLGVGRELVNRVLTWARRHRYRSFEFEVTENNEPAKAFYLSLGFKFSGRNSQNPNYLELTMLGMALPLRTRLMQSHEWQLFRDVRIASLRDSPRAFGMPLAEAMALSDEDWKARTVTRCNPGNFITVLGLAEDTTPAGIASGTLAEGNPAQARIISMWIAPTHRRTGLARLIIADILAWARGKGCTEAVLGVSEGNHDAITLYERLGFMPTGAAEQSRSHPALQIFDMRLEL